MESNSFERYRDIRLGKPITFEGRHLPLKKRSLSALQAAEAGILKEDGSLIYQLAIRHHSSDSLRQIANELGVNRKTVAALFDFFGIPKLSDKEALSREWQQDPNFRRWHELHAVNVLNDPNTKEAKHDARSIHLAQQREDPEFEKARLKALREKNQDLEYTTRRGRAIAARWNEPLFRASHEEAERKKLEGLKQDSRFKSAQAEGLRSSENPSKNTIQGERRDVGFAQSTYEANIARILTFIGVEFRRGVPFILRPEANDESKQRLTALTVDFVTTNKRGHQTVYEIVVRNSTERIKLLEKLASQYPNLGITVITEQRYRRLRKMFEDKINAAPRFAGWETPKDNLKTNPEKFGK